MKKPKPSAQQVSDFVRLPSVALVGVSSDPKKFGATAFTDLRKRGWNVIPVNPKMTTIGEVPCYPDLKSIPESVAGVVSMVPKSETAGVVRQAKEAGITNLWIQQHSETEEVVGMCRDWQMNAIFGECILMHCPPVKSVHGFHRWLNNLFHPLR